MHYSLSQDYIVHTLLIWTITETSFTLPAFGLSAQVPLQPTNILTSIALLAHRQCLFSCNLRIITAIFLHVQILKNFTVTGEGAYLSRAMAAHEVNPLGLHQVMFIPTIQKQGTKQALDKFVQRAQNYEIIGTYAQTEMGHGNVLRALKMLRKIK